MSQKLRMESLPLQKEIPTPVQKTELLKKPTVPDVSPAVTNANDVETKLDLLQQMFTKFLETNQQDKQLFKDSIEEFKKAVNSQLKSQDSPRDFPETPVTSRYEENRRSTMFFGSPLRSPQNQAQIQVLQADIVYDRELKVCSLEGLQYLAKQLQLLSSKYPGREIKTAHMVSFSLRPHVIAAWNSHCYKEFLITGIEAKELMVEDWLTLHNSTVHQILLEAARPRTKELYARELILFLGKSIPQSPPVNTENFSRLFYIPLIKSLNDMLHLYALLSEDISNTSNNKLRMPVSGYGTRESPGHIALWLISLGTQKEAIQQWLGKDDLTKYKAIEPAVKFIRTKLMEARAQSEARQDLDSKLTPIRYEDIRHTQGELHQRQQISAPFRQSNDHTKSHHGQQQFKPSFAAINLESESTDTSELQSSTLHYEDDENNENYFDSTEDTLDNNDDLNDEEDTQIANDLHDYSLTNMDSTRNAIASIFRGFCCEHFVFGKCLKKDSTCNFDHSSKGQEICQQSFLLLAKRDLNGHSNLPPYTRKDNAIPAHRSIGATTNRSYGPSGNSNNVPPSSRPYTTPGPSRPYAPPVQNRFNK